ncbi:hypothetical protein [Candidatus Leptofilum sp.]|uniref:hypothetical protein n=1 Tax=Candidatus Leptofilum sp. TaxID=3241576 RepID=UPI003B5AA449
MAKERSWLAEHSWVVLSLIAVATLFVTAVGYFDEGNHRIYGSFGNYLAKGGVPPLSDYYFGYLSLSF